MPMRTLHASIFIILLAAAVFVLVYLTMCDSQWFVAWEL